MILPFFGIRQLIITCNQFLRSHAIQKEFCKWIEGEIIPREISPGQFCPDRFVRPQKLQKIIFRQKKKFKRNNKTNSSHFRIVHLKNKSQYTRFFNHSIFFPQTSTPSSFFLVLYPTFKKILVYT